MSNWKKIAVFVAGMILVVAFVAVPRMQAQASEPGKVVVSMYRVAPGKHLDFLKWMAVREAIDKEAGLAPGHWYAHTDGDSWDFVGIAPARTEAEDRKIEELSKKKGLKTGFPAALELRQFMASHTDTFARGPMSAADLVKGAGSN
jgi:hypothetical protein